MINGHEHNIHAYQNNHINIFLIVVFDSNLDPNLKYAVQAVPKIRAINGDLKFLRKSNFSIYSQNITNFRVSLI